MKPRIRRVTCGVLLAAQFLAGCTSWQVVDASPRALVDSAHVTKMQVWEAGGAKFVLDAPVVSGDSLTGRVTQATPANNATGEFAREVVSTQSTKLASVNRVAVRKVSGLKTVALVGGILLVAGTVGAMVALNNLWEPCGVLGCGGGGGFSRYW